VAAVLGGERVPITGRVRGSAPDVRHDWLSVEVKNRKVLPAWLSVGMAQARASAKPEQLPVVIVHHVGKRITDSYVVLKLGDFRQWFGGEEQSV
jgi:hypothetical protein